MAINKPDSSINFRFGALGSYKGLTSKSNEDIYFVYTPDSAESGANAYGTIFVNDIMFGSKVFDLTFGNSSTMTFKVLNADGTALEDKEMAYITVEEHTNITKVVQTVENVINDSSLLKNVSINGKLGTVKDNIAGVSISGDDILVGGNGAFKNSSIDDALAIIDASLKSAISAAGVTSFGGQKGDITIRGGQTDSGSVNLTIVDSQLQASIVGLGTAAYEASTAFDVSGAANKALEDSKKYTDDSIQALDASVAPEMGKYVAGFEQVDGKITNVTKTALPSGTFTIKAGVTDIKTFTDNAGTSATVKFEAGKNVSITPNSSEGTISIAAADVTIKKLETAEDGYVASYQLMQDNVSKGDIINIPKDYLVKSAALKTVETADTPYTGAKVGDKYIDFVINVKEGTETDEHIYLPVNDLVDVYTEGNGISISSDNKVSASVVSAFGLSVDSSGIRMSPASNSAAGAMSSLDYTKLSGIENDAQVNKIETIKVNGTALSISDKAVDVSVISGVVINGTRADISNHDASITITGENIAVSGDGAYKEYLVSNAINTLDSSVSKLDTSVSDHETRLTAVEKLLVWHTLSE